MFLFSVSILPCKIDSLNVTCPFRVWQKRLIFTTNETSMTQPPYSVYLQGLWRLPIEDFDRAGSFPWHLMRSLLLLFDVLRDLKDCKTFFFIYQQLNKSPDAGKYVTTSISFFWSRKPYTLFISGTCWQNNLWNLCQFFLLISLDLHKSKVNANLRSKARIYTN